MPTGNRSKMCSPVMPWPMSRELTSRLVEVPISVRMPPSDAAKHMGISRRDGACARSVRNGPISEATTAVLFRKAEYSAVAAKSLVSAQRYGPRTRPSAMASSRRDLSSTTDSSSSTTTVASPGFASWARPSCTLTKSSSTKAKATPANTTAGARRPRSSSTTSTANPRKTAPCCSVMTGSGLALAAVPRRGRPPPRPSSSWCPRAVPASPGPRRASRCR